MSHRLEAAHAKEHSISDEPVIDSDLPIVDAHHHLWFLPEPFLAALEATASVASRTLVPVFRRKARYLFDEFMADIGTGHNIRASVFVDAHAMYRANGPEELKSVGEVEFVNGIAAMMASGCFGETRACAGIVGGVDLRLGDAVELVLNAHVQAGGGRYRGVRSPIVYDSDSEILGEGIGSSNLLADAMFRRGFRRLQEFGLSFDVWLFEPQLPDLVDLAKAFPETQIILNHLGTPLGVGRFTGQRKERFPIWCRNIRRLAECTNVVVKLGGLGIPFCGFESYMANPPWSSDQLANDWRPYIEPCVEAFGANRCMFESNFPVDSAVGSYSVIWNAFKRVSAGASNEEKAALFSGTATRVYRLDI